MLQRTAPALVAAFVILSLAVGLLLLVLWRSSTALESKSAEAERQATEDALTRLPNRLNFDRQFARRLAANGGDSTAPC